MAIVTIFGLKHLYYKRNLYRKMHDFSIAGAWFAGPNMERSQIFKNVPLYSHACEEKNKFMVKMSFYKKLWISKPLGQDSIQAHRRANMAINWKVFDLKKSSSLQQYTF